MKLAEKTAIVTGAGRNIGEEIAVLFAQEGAKVSVVDMDESRAKAVADGSKEMAARQRQSFVMCQIPEILQRWFLPR